MQGDHRQMFKVIFAFAVLSFSAFLLTGCEDPAANKARAVTTAAANSATTSPGGTASSVVADFKPTGTALQISPENSKIGFIGSKVTGKHDGGFNSFNGFIDLVNEKAQESGVVIEIDMKSVFSDADKLTSHLQASDFFDVSKYPKSTFVSTRIVPDSTQGVGNYTVTGDLEMRGVRKSITFPARIEIGPDAVTVDSEFAINRKDFGIIYAGKADDLIRDDVVIRLDLKAPRKK